MPAPAPETAGNPLRAQLGRQLEQLRALTTDPAFGLGPTTVGAELELSLVDPQGHPVLRNLEVVAQVGDPRLQVELDRFNLECNLDPLPLAGRPFTAIANDMHALWQQIAQAATDHGAAPIAVGILPTLRPADLQGDAMTHVPRYETLARALREQRQGQPFQINIHGRDHLEQTCDEVTYEGANTSFQFHLRVAPLEFARMYNAIQLVTPLVVAAGANAPILFGKRLWDETRIALFKQAVDSRTDTQSSWHQPSRVSYGYSWLREGIWESFAENVSLFDPLFHDKLPEEDHGDIPALATLRRHHGTVWMWNRPIYDPAAGGHLRIELRALPAGPTPQDMAANAALTVGLARGLLPQIDAWVAMLPFRYAEHNLYRAAQHGLHARLLWPTYPEGPLREHTAADLLAILLPLAAEGLAATGVESDEIDTHMQLIEGRLTTGQTGAAWQRTVYETLLQEYADDRDTACSRLVQQYMQQAASGKPVYKWDTEI